MFFRSIILPLLLFSCDGVVCVSDNYTFADGGMYVNFNMIYHNGMNFTHTHKCLVWISTQDTEQSLSQDR